MAASRRSSSAMEKAELDVDPGGELGLDAAVGPRGRPLADRGLAFQDDHPVDAGQPELPGHRQPDHTAPDDGDVDGLGHGARSSPGHRGQPGRSAREAGRSARPTAPTPSSRCSTSITTWAEPGSRSRWVSHDGNRPGPTRRPRPPCPAARRPRRPGRPVHSPSTIRIPMSWCRSTRPRALPVQKARPRASWTTKAARMPIWMAVMVDRTVLLLSSWAVRRASQGGPGRTRRRRRPAGRGRGPRA